MALADNIASLVSWYKFDEASGDALDAHGAHPLTDNATVGATTGKIGGARDLVKASSEYFSHADHADFRGADVDMTWAFWVNARALANNTSYVIVSKYGAAGNREFRLYISVHVIGATKLAVIQVSGDGTALTSKNDATFGNLAINTWYLIIGKHDAANNVIGLSINGAAFQTAAHATGIFAGSADLNVGREASATNLFDGFIDEGSVWRGYAFSDADAAEYYNSGNGITYADLLPAEEEEAAAPPQRRGLGLGMRLGL